MDVGLRLPTPGESASKECLLRQPVPTLALWAKAKGHGGIKGQLHLSYGQEDECMPLIVR